MVDGPGEVDADLLDSLVDDEPAGRNGPGLSSALI